VAAAPASASLETKLDRALRAQGVASGQTGAAVFDLRRSRFVYGHYSKLALKPASNEKLPVSVTALSTLGVGYKIPTELRGDGHQAGSVWKGRLVLKGYGDPALSSSQLGKLARAVANDGITRVSGAIVGDESFYDKARVAPGWKASFYKDECPPLSALIVDRGRYKGQITGNPALAAAKQLRTKLVDRGIKVGGKARLGRADASTTVLASVTSPALRWLVRTMNRRSDNFYAEMLVKQLGAREGKAGTTSAGTRVVRRVLRQHGIPMRGLVLADGSGLSAYDRLTPKSVTTLLVWAMSDSGFNSVFMDSLPLAGVNGTLADRMESGPAYRNVRAKTGTTDAASALSGYVRRRYAFSILMNGNPIPWWYARRAQDRFAQVLAAQ
jgi:D-alanyl-D-alanine carboxypeptidase/D-alanyl-D-alanine-endopeptidase (penicillin-binding protein 4)